MIHSLHPKRYTLIAILLLSVVFRIAIALYYGDIIDAPSLLTDQRSYHYLAARLIEGHGYSFERPWYPYTFANTPTAFWSFAYALFVAGVYAIFGVHPLAARVMQAILGGFLLPWMVYRLAATLFGAASNAETQRRRKVEIKASGIVGVIAPLRSVPLLAALWAAMYPYFAMYSATIMTETFFIVALLWSLEVALRLARVLRHGEPVPWQLTVQLGFSLGIAAVLRQSILPWAPVLFLWLLIAALKGQGITRFADLRRVDFKLKSLLPLIMAGLILISCILPWTIRNYVVYDQFLLLNSNTGYAMYSAQHPMHGTRFREFDAAPLPEGFVRGNEAEMDKALMHLGIGFVLEDPVRYLLLSLSRIRAYFEFWPTPDTTLIHNLGRVASYGVALPFIVYGLVLAIIRAWHIPNPKSATAHRETLSDQLTSNHPASSIHYPTSSINHPAPADLAMILLFVIFYSILHILTWAMVRYRLPVDAVTLPFAALALRDICGRMVHAFKTRLGKRGKAQTTA